MNSFIEGKITGLPLPEWINTFYLDIVIIFEQKSHDQTT